MRKRQIFLFTSAVLLLLSCQIAYIETATPGPATPTIDLTAEFIATTAAQSTTSPEESSITPPPGTSTSTPITPTFTPIVVTATYTDTPFAVTNTPILMCTPPACAENESYFCPGGSCPGGCGTVCATNTPSAAEDAWWQPQPGLTFHLQYTGDIDLTKPVDVYNLDLFETDAETIERLHERGTRVICYFSAGTYEDWRPDADQFPQAVLGNALANWPGERWLDIRRIDLLAPIITARLDLAALAGCDGVDPDNVEGYTQPTGFSLTPNNQLAYNRWLAKQAHDRGLAIGLKNDLGQAPILVDDFDFAVNEECHFYQDCELLEPFIRQDKAVFGIEYELDPEDFCAEANAAGYMFAVKDQQLGAFQIPCWEQ